MKKLLGLLVLFVSFAIQAQTEILTFDVYGRTMYNESYESGFDEDFDYVDEEILVVINWDTHKISVKREVLNILQINKLKDVNGYHLYAYYKDPALIYELVILKDAIVIRDPSDEVLILRMYE